MLEHHRDAVAGMSVLIAIAQAGSLTAAAQKLGLTSSAVSKQVSRLEARLRTRLLHRTTRRVQLTEAGARYCERARLALEAIESIEREFETREDVPRGTLRITAPTVLGQVRVLPVVLSFQRRYPDVAVHAEFSDRQVDLVEEGVDLAVRITSRPPPTLVARRLDDDRRVLCASPEYLAKRGVPRRPADLADHDCILFVTGRPVDTWRLRATQGASRPTPVRISGRLHLNNTLALREAALGGLGIADLPYYLVEEELQARRLQSVLEPFVPVERQVFAIYATAPYVPAKVRHFVQALEEAFGRTRA